jgi:hypothetical protein
LTRSGQVFDIIGRPIFESLRRSGSAIVVRIKYSNTWSLNPSAFQYTYRASVLSEMEAKQMDEALNVTSLITRGRTVFNRHGFSVIFILDGSLPFIYLMVLKNTAAWLYFPVISVLVIVIAATCSDPQGTIGALSLFSILLALGSSVGLVTIATVVVDYFLVLLTKEKAIYKAAKCVDVRASSRRN